jgi:hypothetical protein
MTAAQAGRGRTAATRIALVGLPNCGKYRALQPTHRQSTERAIRKMFVNITSFSYVLLGDFAGKLFAPARATATEIVSDDVSNATRLVRQLIAKL